MAQRRSHVPKFGTWDTNDHMPYTAVFDNARHGRGKPINPNDPSENPGAFNAAKGNGAPGRRPFNPSDPEDTMDDPDPSVEMPEKPAEGGNRDGSSRGHTEGSRDGSSRGHTEGSRDGSSRGERQQQIAAGAAARRVAAGPAHGNGVPSRPPPAVDAKRPSRDNSHDRSVESPSTSFSADQSPAHPSGYQRGTRLGAASPAWESRRKSTGEDAPIFAPATPTRSRLRGGMNPKDDHSAKGAAALPKFGEWDAQDPGSGDGFTVIFNNAINEKKAGVPVSIPRTPDHKNVDLYESNGDYNKGQKSRCWFCFGAPNVKA